MKNKWISWIVILLLIAAVGGSFTIRRRSLRSTDQVAGIALDASDGEILATFELYEPDLKKTIGTAKRIVKSHGYTLSECLDNARLVNGKNLYAGDIAALIIGKENREKLQSEVLEYYRLLENDQMSLPIFYAVGNAGAILDGGDAVLSTSLASSGKLLGRIQTIRDLMNNAGTPVLVRGEGGYEILS